MANDTHDDSDGAKGAHRNMPADRPRKLGRTPSSSGGGTHKDSGADYGPTPKPTTLGGATDEGDVGSAHPNVPATLEFGNHDPRRSHS